MCLTVNSSKVPTRGRWGYKAMPHNGTHFISCMQFKWTPGTLHMPKGKANAASLTVPNARINGGILHLYIKMQDAIECGHEYIVRVWVPEYCTRCVGYYNSREDVPNIGAAACYMPKTGYCRKIYGRGKSKRWAELPKGK